MREFFFTKKKREKFRVFCQREFFLGKMATSNFQPQIPSFNGKDYDMWAIKMETMLKAHDVWDHVKYGFGEPKDDAEERALSNAEREEWKKDKRKNVQAFLPI